MLRSLLSSLSSVVILMTTTVLAADPKLDAATFKPEGSDLGLKYRILKPETKAGEKLPLVLCFHGAGERGDDNEKHIGYFVPMWTGENATNYRAFFVLPQVPNNQLWASYGWSTKTDEMQPEPSQTMSLTRKLVDELLKNLPIDPDRIYVTGLSMGGYGTWEFGQRYSDITAAIAPVCGGGDPRLAERIKHIPVWAFHGDKDGVVKVTETTKVTDALKKAGAQPKVTIYEGVGHDSWRPAYREKDLLKWMFAQRRATK